MIVKDLIGNMVNGVIFTSLLSLIKFDALAKYDIPMVFIERAGNIENAGAVLINEHKGSFDAGNLLIQNGRTKIAFIGHTPVYEVVSITHKATPHFKEGGYINEQP